MTTSEVLIEKLKEISENKVIFEIIKSHFKGNCYEHDTNTNYKSIRRHKLTKKKIISETCKDVEKLREDIKRDVLFTSKALNIDEKSVKKFENDFFPHDELFNGKEVFDQSTYSKNDDPIEPDFNDDEFGYTQSKEIDIQIFNKAINVSVCSSIERQVYESNIREPEEETTISTNTKQNELEHLNEKTICLEAKSQNENIPMKKSKTNIHHIMDELFETEKLYLDKLKTIVMGYEFIISELQQNLGIFENIGKLYKYSEEFYEKLIRCKTHEDIPPAIFSMEDTLFSAYRGIIEELPIAVKYVNQTENYERLKEVRKTLNQKFELHTLLNDIMKRLVSYVEIFKRIKKEINKTNQRTDLYEKAIDLIENILKQGNTHAALYSIDNNPLSMEETGMFIFNGDFDIKKDNNKYRGVVFLFENMIVITKDDKASECHYIFQDYVEFQYMMFQHRKNKYSFKIVQQRPGRASNKYYLSIIPPNNEKKWKTELTRKRKMSLSKSYQSRKKKHPNLMLYL